MHGIIPMVIKMVYILKVDHIYEKLIWVAVLHDREGQ